MIKIFLLAVISVFSFIMVFKVWEDFLHRRKHSLFLKSVDQFISEEETFMDDAKKMNTKLEQYEVINDGIKNVLYLTPEQVVEVLKMFESLRVPKGMCHRTAKGHLLYCMQYKVRE